MGCSAASAEVFAADMEGDFRVVAPELELGKHFGKGSGKGGVDGCDDAAETV